MKKTRKTKQALATLVFGASLCGLFAVARPPFAFPGAVDEAELVGVWRVDLKRRRFALVDSNWRRLPLPVRDGEAEKFRLTLNAETVFSRGKAVSAFSRSFGSVAASTRSATYFQSGGSSGSGRSGKERRG